MCGKLQHKPYSFHLCSPVRFSTWWCWVTMTWWYHWTYLYMVNCSSSGKGEKAIEAFKNKSGNLEDCLWFHWVNLKNKLIGTFPRYSYLLYLWFHICVFKQLWIYILGEKLLHKNFWCFILGDNLIGLSRA
jgi:hypothetical protein